MEQQSSPNWMFLQASIKFQIEKNSEDSVLSTHNLDDTIFLRLPFGIKSATEVMYRTVTQLLEGLEGIKKV